MAVCALYVLKVLFEDLYIRADVIRLKVKKHCCVLCGISPDSKHCAKAAVQYCMYIHFIVIVSC